MLKRVLTTLALVPFAIYTIFYGPPWFFNVVVYGMAIACYFEFSGLVAANGVEPPGLPGLIGVTLLIDTAWVRIVAMVAFVLSLRFQDMQKALPYAAAMVLGAVYTFGAWRCAIDLRALSPNWILFALAINWVGDVAALYTGKAIGKHKLAPLVSPGKTIEGAAGSMVAAIVFGLAFRQWLMPKEELWLIILLSIVANVAGQIGDLAESAMKRGGGVKDSGTLIPGHGGFLDRMDSSLFTMPVVYGILLGFGSLH